MLLVVVIIAVMAGTMVASLQGRKDAQALRVGTEDLAAALRYASWRFTDQGQPMRVALLAGGRGFQLQWLDSDGQARPLAGNRGQERMFAREVHVQRVGGGPDGQSVGAVPDALDFAAGEAFCGWLELGDALGATRRIEVADATGQVRIVE